MVKVAAYEWLTTLDTILHHGAPVAPRGQKTLELAQHTVRVDMRHPVVAVPKRKLSYKFLGAEAFWILTGDDTVEGIAPWNERIASYSDDGATFFGAYGPRIREQLDYVVGKLAEDPSTRQAGLTTWRPNPPQTKDYPCTIAFWFMIRDGFLNCHVFMRSSDAWLGLPYDVFNFSMLAHLVCCRLNLGRGVLEAVEPGALFLTMASSHLYEQHWSDARALVDRDDERFDRFKTQPTTTAMFRNETMLLTKLKDIRESTPGHSSRWWEVE